MTIDITPETPITPTRGCTFTYSSGTGIVLMPSEDGTWTILNPTLQVVESIRLDHVSWEEGRSSDEQILMGLVDACRATFTRAMHDRAEVDRLDATISDIREYAIDKHREGHYCREGLNDALTHFGLDRYEPRYLARVTVSATAEINADTARDAELRLRHLIDGIAYSGDRADDDLDMTFDDLDISGVEPM